MSRCYSRNLIGQKFGRLMVVKTAERNIRNQRTWLCKCDCGKEKIIRESELVGGRTKSCGCLNKEIRNNIKNFSKRLEYGEASFNSIFVIYMRTAKRRGLCFNLSREYFKKTIKENCAYCGREPMQKINSKTFNGDFLYNGIDRIDNKKDYTEDNVVACCSKCNFAKKAMSQQEFYDWIDRVYNHIHREDKK